ncbi:MAG TPA: hypothetical protein VMS77_06830 [Conexivisphaerales archaeon]|nr:hypothetical protein [Conexivisphaerales archaeon]
MPAPTSESDSVEALVEEISRNLEAWVKAAKQRAISDALGEAAFIAAVIALGVWVGLYSLLIDMTGNLPNSELHLLLTVSISLAVGAVVYYWKYSRRARYIKMEVSLKRLKAGTQASRLEDAMLALDSLIASFPEITAQMGDDVWYYAGLAFTIGLFLGGIFPFGILLGFFLGGSTWIYFSRKAIVRMRREVEKYKGWSSRLNQQRDSFLRDM